jgi:hypothetical protein
VTIYIYNPDAKNTPQPLIDDIQAFMVNKPKVTGAQLIAGVPALSGLTRPEQEQAVIDSGFTFMEVD